LDAADDVQMRVWWQGVQPCNASPPLTLALRMVCLHPHLFRCREMLRNSPTALRVLKSALNAAEDGQAGIQVRVCAAAGREQHQAHP
jgi:hypothetical protein